MDNFLTLVPCQNRPWADGAAGQYVHLVWLIVPAGPFRFISLRCLRHSCGNRAADHLLRIPQNNSPVYQCVFCSKGLHLQSVWEDGLLDYQMACRPGYTAVQFNGNPIFYFNNTYLSTLFYSLLLLSAADLVLKCDTWRHQRVTNPFQWI